MAFDLWYQLPPDMTTWNTAVVENVARKIPEIPSYISSITWSKLDPASGTGEGLIELMGGLGAAPIIIKNNKLAPIDLLVTKADGEVKFYPLSPLFLQKLYADNVIGEAANNMSTYDEDYTGPSKRIQHIKTVDAVKYASKHAAQTMLDEITKIASVANWFLENRPELITALNDKANEVEKTASDEYQLPELSVVWKDRDTFYGNGEPISIDQVQAFCKTANVSDKEKEELFSGVPIIRDNREKIAKLHIPPEYTHEQYKAINPEDTAYTGIALTSAVLKDGRHVPGIIFTKLTGRITPNSDALRDKLNTHNVHTNTPEVDDTFKDCAICSDSKEVFISDCGYNIDDAIYTTTRIPVSGSLIATMSEASDPAIGMIGIVLYNDSPQYFGRVVDVRKHGEYKYLLLYNLVSHNEEWVNLKNSFFYEVEPGTIPTVRDIAEVSTISVTGVNGIVSRDNSGNLVIDGKSYSVINCPYALMSKYAASYEDAVEVCKVASVHGRCVFEVLEQVEKEAAQNDNQDTTKNKGNTDNTNKDKKGTKAGTDDEPTDQQANLQGQSPESLMSVDLYNDPVNGFGVPVAPNIMQSMPVSAKDMENVVQMNAPQVMDAYVLGNLASNSMASRESILRASDSIMNALSHLSQLLFLVRQGSLDYLSESDVQVAMNKLTDVAQALGINTIQVN